MATFSGHDGANHSPSTTAEDLASVGRGFVHQFFGTLNNTPVDLFKFFGEDSAFTFSSKLPENSSSFSAIGSSSIRQALDGLDLTDVRFGKIDLPGVITQPSGSNVLILTSGLWISISTRSVRSFVASFCLTASGADAYYVLNASLLVLPPPSEIPGNTSSPPPPASLSEPEPVSPPHQAPVDLPPVQQEPVVPQPAEPAPPSPNIPAPAAAPTPKKTWTQLVAGGAKAPASQSKPPQNPTSAPPSSPSANPAGERAPGRNSDRKPTAAPASSSSSSSSSRGARPAASNPTKKPKSAKAPNSLALIIRNPPLGTAPEELRSIFDPFGRVISIRPDPAKKSPFFFVTLSTLKDPEATLQGVTSKPLSYKGHSLKIELQRSTTRRSGRPSSSSSSTSALNPKAH
ncbi:MAG: ketosteroid isomerase family protein [archaeon]|nr:ketosteroid isomerase family protein [archaeon]